MKLQRKAARARTRVPLVASLLRLKAHATWMYNHELEGTGSHVTTRSLIISALALLQVSSRRHKSLLGQSLYLYTI